MKRLLIIAMIICLFPLSSHADEVDDALPPDTPAKVRESARQAIGAGVESQGVLQMTRTMLEHQYREKEILKAHEVLMTAEKDNLPQEPVMAQFRESVANGEKAKITVKAMESVRKQYKSAGDIAGNMTQDRQHARIMTESVVQCMNAGMTSGDIQRISITLQTRTRDMPPVDAHAFQMATLGTAKQMAQAGASSGSTANVVRNALKQQYNAKEMGQLGTTFSAQVKNAGSATQLANDFANAIKNGGGADNVSAMAARVSGDSRSQGTTGSGSRNTDNTRGGSGSGNSGGSGSRGHGR